MSRLITDETVNREILEGKAEDISALADDLDSQLDTITAEFAADDNDVRFMLKVYRVVPKTGKLEYLFTVTPAELPIMDRLRDEHGGGDYEIRVYKNNKLHRKLTECIGAPPPKPLFQPKDNSTEIMQGFNKLAELLAAQKAQPSVQTGTNALEMMTGFAALITAMKPLFDRPATPAVPAVPQHDPLELVLKGMEMAREFGGEGNTGSTMMDILRDVVKGVAPALANMAATQAAAPAALPHNPGGFTLPPPVTIHPPVPAAPGNNPQPANAKVQPPMMQSLQNIAMKKYIAMLCKKASEDANPELYAELILDNVPYETVKSYLSRPNLADEMAKLDGNVNKFRPWFAELETVLRGMLQAAEAEDAPAAGLTGAGESSDTAEHDSDSAPDNPE
jgi:hypothetical protein